MKGYISDSLPWTKHRQRTENMLPAENREPCIRNLILGGSRSSLRGSDRLEQKNLRLKIPNAEQPQWNDGGQRSSRCCIEANVSVGRVDCPSEPASEKGRREEGKGRRVFHFQVLDEALWWTRTSELSLVLKTRSVDCFWLYWLLSLIYLLLTVRHSVLNSSSGSSLRSHTRLSCCRAVCEIMLVVPLHLGPGLGHFRAPQDANRLSCLCCKAFSTQRWSDTLLHSLPVAPAYLLDFALEASSTAAAGNRWHVGIKAKEKEKAHILSPLNKYFLENTFLTP